MPDHKRNLARALGRYEAARMARTAAIRDAYAGGLSYREIADIMGLSHSRIQQIVTGKRA